MDSNEYGGIDAQSPETPSELSGQQSPEIMPASVPLQIGSSDIDDVIAKHLIDCDQCREGIGKGPVKLGEKSRHCDQYWHLQLLRARYEGKINNIVAHTELGDEAPIRGKLE
jgi:hypothetical protein